METQEELKKLYVQFSTMICLFLSSLDDKSLYIVFENVIAEMNRRKEGQ